MKTQRKSARSSIRLKPLKADVLVLPELVLSGYTAADLFLRAPLLEGVLDGARMH